MRNGSMSITLDYSTPVPLRLKKQLKPAIIPSSTYKSYYSQLRPVKLIKDSRDNKLLDSFSKSNHQHQEFNLEFFKYLAELCETNKLFLPIPETIIIGYGFNSAVLLYNDEKGLICCEKDFSSMHLKVLIELFESYRVHNYKETFGPLAILRKPDSNYNRVLMKPGEIVLEWKNAYKVNVIIQRFVINKGTKSSKFRVLAQGNSIKVLKIVNKARNDLENTDEVQGSKKNTYQGKLKNSDNEPFIDTKMKLDIIQEYSKGKNESPLNIIFSKIGEVGKQLSRHGTLKGVRKSFIVNSSPVVATKKRVIMNLKDYLTSCYPKNCEKSVEDLRKILRNCKYNDYDFKIDTEELLYVSYYNDKLFGLFTVNGKNLINTDVFEVKSTKKLEKLSHLVEEVKNIMNFHILKPKSQKLSKIVCDFIEDGFQNTFFLKIKSYECFSVNFESKKLNFDKKFECPGQYCKPHYENSIPVRTFEVLKKQLKLNAQFNLGINSKDYERVRVCEPCYKKYAKNPIIRKKSLSISDLNIKKLDKFEVSGILEQINPSGANETCKILPRRNKSLIKTPSTMVSEKVNNTAHIYKKSSWSRKRKNYFKLKIDEIGQVVNQNEFDFYA